MTERLLRENRLNQPRQYQQVFASSLKTRDQALLFIAKKNGLGKARLGLAISKKRVNKAVKRNLIKRLIRESFRKNQSRLSGLDIVVVSHRNLENTTKKQIQESIEKNWRKLQQCKS